MKLPRIVEPAFSLFDTPRKRRNRLKSYRHKYGDLLSPSGAFAARGIAHMLRKATEERNGDSFRTLIELADSATTGLFDLAKSKNAGAMLEFLNLLQERTHDLYLLARESPDLARLFAQRSEGWPVLLYRRTKHRRAMERFVLKKT